MSEIINASVFHGRRSRGGGGGEGGAIAPQFLPNFCKISLFASNFSISMPTAPSRSSQPPHFQIHSAVYVFKLQILV